MTTLDMGYDYTNLAYMNIESSNSNPTQAQLLMDEISKLPEVGSVTFATSIPMFGSSGDNVYLPGTSENLFNCENLYYSGTNYFDVMNIPIVSGSGFTSTTPGEQVMVSRSFAEMMKSTAGWDDNIVGRQVCITSYKNPMTIVGVYEDFMIGTVGEEDEGPSAMVTAWYPVSNLLIKYHSLDAAAMSVTEALATRLVPDKEYHMYSYEDDLIACYQDTRNFRDSVLIGGVMTLLIVLCGLIGFTGDEVNFRKKEIAIRKVLDADSQNTVGLILGNVTKIAVPAVIVGALVAVLISRNWLQQFSEKISLGWYIFLTGAVVVLLVCELIAAYNVIRATMENPAESLKSE